MKELIEILLTKELNMTFELIELKFDGIDSENFRRTKISDLPLYHFGLGTWIRNNILHHQSKIYALFVLNGIIEKDDMSSIIIRKFHEYLNNKVIGNV